MTIGSSRPSVTKIVAGPIRIAAVDSRPPRCSRAASASNALAATEAAILVRLLSALELLVPEIAQIGTTLGQELEIGIRQHPGLLLREADALAQVGRHLRIADHGVVAHVDREGFLRGRLERGVEECVRALLVRGVLRDREPRYVGD